jgi:hypothetical protein
VGTSETLHGIRTRMHSIVLDTQDDRVSMKDRRRRFTAASAYFGAKA